MKLYPAQQTIADQIIDAYQLPQTDQALYLSGEMGVGKTYIGAYLAHWMLHHTHQSVVIVSPSIVIDKWLKILKDTDQSVTVNKLTNKNYNIILDQTPSINILNANTLKSFTTFIDGYHDQINLIIDEVQELNSTKLNYLETLLKLTNYKLMMTGTIFDNLDTGLPTLIQLTNPSIINYATTHSHLTHIDQIVKDLPIFMKYIWQYISVSLSLTEIKKHQTHLLVQNIEPINYIPLTPIEEANYNLALTANSLVHPELFASNLLDDPSQSPIINHKTHGELFNQPCYEFVSLPLEPIKFNQTAKYQALCEYLSQIDCDKKVIIYATNCHVIHQLARNLQHDHYQATALTQRSSQIQTKINHLMQQFNILIVDPKLIKVGIDINAQYIIWYQLLSHMTDILQAQRRITRLNSDTPSNVKYLAYDHTSQRQLLDNISQANKSNAAAYGVNDTSNLSKITGLLLPKHKGCD